MQDLYTVDNGRALFLDRDGVINIERHLKYINTWDEFIFYDGAKEALYMLAARFHYIFVVTNQRGVAKGLTKPEDLYIIHHNMVNEIEKAGGRIDKIYCCTDMDENSIDRKPNTGMGLQAKKDFETINFSKSIMVGDKLSDMEFGRNLGCKTVFLKTTNTEVIISNPLIDAMYNSLLDFAKAL